MSSAVAFALPFALLASAGPVHAEIKRTDVLVATRAIGFISKFHGGDLRVGIVVAPESPQSVEDGNQLKAIFGTEMAIGNNMLKPVMLRTDQVANADVGLFFLTEGTGAAASRVASASKARKIPCITFDLAQVKSGACTIGVQSQPKIEIFVNRKAAAESNTIFSSVFRLMITEY